MIEARHGSLEAADILAILGKPRDVEQSAFGVGASAEAFVNFVQERPTRGGTWFVNGEPAVMAGLTLAGPGRLHAWMIADRDIKPFRKTVIRDVRRYLDMARDFSVTTTIKEDDNRLLRWMAYLGFEKAPIHTKPHYAAYQRKAT